MPRHLVNRLITVGLIFASIIVLGALGYFVLEGWPLIDAFYMSVITVTTVGFGEVRPLSEEGRLFTSALILLGVGGITYGFTSISQYLIAGELKGLLEDRRMHKSIEHLEGHIVVCGFGDTGREVCNEFRREGVAAVVIDARLEAVQEARDEGALAIMGDAGHDAVLLEAGIERASGLVASTNEDSTNLLVALSARALNPGLSIAARANSDEAIQKLHRAGADRVLFPHEVVGRRLAQMLIRPEVCDFLDVVTSAEGLELLLENLSVAPDSRVDGHSILDARIREETGVHLVGLKRGRDFIVPLRPSTVLQVGDVLFAVGNRNQLKKLQKLVAG